MAENVTRLQYEEKEIILVGTAHVSATSVELVKETIAQEMPDSVCIELDEARYQAMQNPKAWEKTDVSQIIRDKKVGQVLIQLVLSSYQKRMAQKLGTDVGGEMRQGIESAKEIGAQIVLADRNVQTTFLRIWRLLGLKEKTKLLFALFLGEDEEEGDITEEDLAALLQQDMLESILAEMRKELPIIGQVLIDERDQYLANKIKTAPGPKVLAVLGGAHVPGVMEELYKEQDMVRLASIPPKKSRAKYIAWLIPIILIGLIAYSFTQGIDTGAQTLASWFIWNGGGAALFAILALARPLSILAAFVTAPFTTFMGPLAASGFFAGLVEAWSKKPTVEDLQKLPDDIFSFKGWWFRNRFLKVLLVVILTNLGSTIGGIVAGADIVRNLFG